MNKLKLDRPWNEVKEKLKEADPTLSDDDLRYDGENNAAELVQHLARKKGKDEEFIRGWIESVSSNAGKAG